MSWAVGNNSDGRWIGYGVPAECDHPECTKEIDRGLSYLCDWEDEDGEEVGCGLFFCEPHGAGWLCERCRAYSESDPATWQTFEPKPDSAEWVTHILTDESWRQWRNENPGRVQKMRERLL